MAEPRTDSPLKFKRYQDCPDAAKLHVDAPRDMNLNGYSPTKRQVRCPSCGFWSMWVTRQKVKRIDWSNVVIDEGDEAP